jgi:uncharacterized protein
MGYPEAHYRFAKCILDDAHSNRNGAKLASGAKILEQAAQKGHVHAMFELADMNQRGYGLPVNNKTAMHWFKIAAMKGHMASQTAYAELLEWHGPQTEESLKEAASFYKLAAEQGDPAAQNNLGVCYRHGKGVPRDMEMAIKYFRWSAGKGYAAGQNHLGQCYQLGTGVQIDLDEAISWYTKASDQSFSPGQNNLALLYEEGVGVDQDSEMALKLFLMAAQVILANLEW